MALVAAVLCSVVWSSAILSATPSTPDRTFTFFPDENPYTAKVADPRHASFGILPLNAVDSEIEGATSERVALRVGGVFPVLVFHREGDVSGGWFISIETSFYGQLDRGDSADLIGFNGVYALHVSHAFGDGWVFNTAWHHLSSHLADEFIEKTGRERTGYARDEVQGGISKVFGRRWRAFGEVGYGASIEEAFGQEEWRVQGGLEYEAPETLWKGRSGWYVAGSISSWEENDWDPDIAVEGGLLFLSAKDRHRYRLLLSYYQGRIPISDFFEQDEAYVSFGLAMDF